MRVWWLSLWTPFLIAALGLVVGFLSYPKVDASGPFLALAFGWVLFTGKARKTYWNARLRSKAAYDEQRSRT